MNCYQINYLQGKVCGCYVAETREAAIARFSPGGNEFEEGEGLVNVTATRKKPGHICTARLDDRGKPQGAFTF